MNFQTFDPYIANLDKICLQSVKDLNKNKGQQGKPFISLKI